MKEEKIIQFLVEKYSFRPVEDDKGLFVKDDNEIRLYWIDDIDGKEGFNTYDFFGIDEIWAFTGGKVDKYTIDSLWFEISLTGEMTLSPQFLLFTNEGI